MGSKYQRGSGWQLWMFLCSSRINHSLSKSSNSLQEFKWLGTKLAFPPILHKPLYLLILDRRGSTRMWFEKSGFSCFFWPYQKQEDQKCHEKACSNTISSSNVMGTTSPGKHVNWTAAFFSTSSIPSSCLMKTVSGASNYRLMLRKSTTYY